MLNNKNFKKNSFYITIAGPNVSVYEGRYFDLQIVFNDSFPEHPPVAIFTPQGQTGDIPRNPVYYYLFNLLLLLEYIYIFINMIIVSTYI